MSEDQGPATGRPDAPESAEPMPGRRIQFAAVLAAAVALGAGAAAVAQRGHTVTVVALDPAPVASMKDGTMVAVKGGVAETFGNKFVMQDGGGRALIETGRRGEGRGLVAKGEEVTVQGRFEHGFVHAMAIRHPDGHSDVLDPSPPRRPPRPRRGPERSGPPV